MDKIKILQYEDKTRAERERKRNKNIKMLT